jgi:hypothetical protein
MSDTFDAQEDALSRTAVFSNARTAPFPTRTRRKSSPRRTSILRPSASNGRCRVAGPAYAPREPDETYLARVATAAAAYGPEERRALKRADMIPQQLALEARIDFDNLRRETERPLQRLRDYELREVQAVDRGGRFISEFFAKDGEAGGPKLWMANATASHLDSTDSSRPLPANSE